MVSITLPEKMSEEIDALIKEGYYDNRSEMIRDAIKLYFAHKAEIRLVAAIRLYKDGKATMAVMKGNQMILQINSGNAYTVNNSLNNNSDNLTDYAQEIKALLN